MHGIDRRQDLVATRSHPGGQALANQLMTFGDECRVPGPSVLLVQRDQFAVRRDPGRAAGLREQHQGQQPDYLTVLWHEGTDQSGEPDGLSGEILTYRIGVGAGGQVALVEDEVENGEYAGDPSWEILCGRYPVGDARRFDLGLGPGDPLTHGGLLYQEGPGDLRHGQTTDHPQRQRHPGLDRKRRVTAGEDQPESLVVDGSFVRRIRRALVLVPHLSFQVLSPIACSHAGSDRWPSGWRSWSARRRDWAGRRRPASGRPPRRRPRPPTLRRCRGRRTVWPGRRPPWPTRRGGPG